MNANTSLILRGTCNDRIPQILDFIEKNTNKKSKIHLYINPPRTGLGVELAKTICIELKPDKIAYLSCSQGTLAKDLNIFTNHECKVIKIKNFDFFPFTQHFESLVFLKKRINFAKKHNYDTNK